MKNFNLDKKIILITGAAGRIGSALAEEAIKLNAFVILTDIDQNKLNTLTEKLISKKAKLISICIDLTTNNGLEILFRKIFEKVDKIDAAIHCMYPVSKGFGDSFENLKQENLFEDLNKQLGLAILFSQKIMLQFQNQGYGDLIHISSIQGVQAPKFSHYQNTNMNSPIEYSAIKSGIISITRWLAKFIE